jgi:hypothetical protein
MSDELIDVGETRNPIVSVPRSGWSIIGSLNAFGLNALLFFGLGLYLLKYDPAAYDRPFVLALVAGFCLLAFFCLMVVRMIWKLWISGPLRRLVLISAIFSFTAALLLYKPLSHHATVLDGCFLVAVVAGFCFLAALLNLILLGLALGPTLAVHKAGIEIQWEMLPWEKVDSCHWGHQVPSVLRIRTDHRGLSVSVPESYRAPVEAALRRFGKWRD